MSRAVMLSVVAAVLGVLLPGPGIVADDAGERHYQFDVYLDDKRIGSHEYRISRTDSGIERVRSEADFDVRFLAIPVYRYVHRNTEVWRGGCLESVDATTRTNGQRTNLSGQRTASGFAVDGRADALPDCVRTFAYWDPALLEQDRLLNPQTGQFVPVRIERSEAVSPGTAPSTVYRIQAGDREIAVWYSESQQWLGLEAVVKGGRILRYVRS